METNLVPVTLEVTELGTIFQALHHIITSIQLQVMKLQLWDKKCMISCCNCKKQSHIVSKRNKDFFTL